jgi:PAS domain S-box-containing protein
LFASIDPVVDSTGRTIAVVEVTRDLSELYRAREEAERHRTGLMATIEQMAEGLVVCDQDGRVIHANRRAQEILGFSLEGLRSDNNGWLSAERYRDLDGRPCQPGELPIEVALAGQMVGANRRISYRRPDDSTILLSVTASPFFSEQGRLAGAVALVGDVTEQQREHDRRQQADKLRALGQLASGVAHNFNNALAAVIGYTQLGLRKARDPEVQKYLTVIEQSAKDAARMVERIQNFSRGRSRTDEFAPTRLWEIVYDAIEITRPRWRDDAEALGIEYNVSQTWLPSEGLLVNAEPSELREVFVNIIFNALDAMPNGGSLRVIASADQTTVSVAFADDGAGMTEEIQRRVFEPFFTTKGMAGLGMGMSESYRIIERHGGRIDIESELHKGATFIVTLPLAETPRIHDLPAPQVPAEHTCVMVVDDEEPVRRVLSAILTDQGHEVVQAASASEALSLLESHPIDVVFTDLAMPQIDGVAAAEEIKKRRPAVKVVLMSGYGVDKAYERAGAGFIDAVVTKPFSFPEIQETLQGLAGVTGTSSVRPEGSN